MKKIIAYILIGILCIAAAAGIIYGVNYKKANTKPTEIVEEQEDLSSEEALKKAEKYLKTIYKDVEKETPRDYERIGVVPIGNFKFQVTWSVDVSEEYVKIVVNENGIVTIDVNEECSEDVPYVLTATIKDEKGNIRKLTWEHVIPKKITGTYQEIVDMAYALKSGESLPNEATLQGTVTTINTPWDSGYQNITVTITVEGREDKPIQCYRMKSGAADASKVEKGDLITVTGILKNYNGTIEFDAGCVLDANEKGKGTILKVSGTMQEIVDKAYALKDGETLKGEATLTGTVTAINTAWSDQYKNISVTIAVEGREDKPIQCYRLKSGAADASKIAKGDLITVTGVLKNFKGTIEFDAGCILDANEKGKGTILKVTGTMQEIVDKAYALKEGEVLKGEATLTGTVTAINTAWSDDFKNISVTIVVEGRESKPIQCYRMKSGAADASKVAKGDLITVTGILKNYNGTIEFDAGCTLEANKKGAGTIETVTGSMQEIVDKAYALAEGEMLTGEATLQGTVTAIGSAWSDQYKNITVTIAVEGREDKPIECYRLKSGAADASKIEKGDLITVTGMIKNYNGKIEFDAGCTLDANQKGAGTINTVTGTMQEIVDKAYALEVGAALEGEATLTGSVTKVDTPYSEQYGNVTVTIVVDGRESKPIKCFRLKGTNADKVAAGDLITVTGIIKNYNGTIEFDQGCEMTEWVQGGGSYVPEEPDEPDVPVVPDEPDVPVVPSTAYKMSMYQGNVDKTVYFTGEMDSFYFATTENKEDGVDVYKEEVEGGTYLYFMVGDTANYLYIYKNGTYTNVGFTEDVSLASVFVLNEEANTYVTTVEGEGYFLGTRNDRNYTTISACHVDYIGTNFKAVLEEVEVPEETPTAYKLSMYQGNVDKTVYFTGEMDSFYFATTENKEDGVDVYKEEVEGGTYLYFMVGDTVNYLYIYKNGTYTNVGFTEDVSLASVFVLNEEANTYVTTVEGEGYFLGTRNDRNYTTISACHVDYIGTNFKAVLEEVEDNESDTAATLADAIAGLQAEYTEEMNVTGEYVLAPSIAIDSTEFTITWSIQTANEAVANIVDGKLVIVAGAEDVEYTLTATVQDAAGATDTWTKTATVAKKEEVGIPTTPKEILEAAYALETGATLEEPNPATLVGTIISIDTAYSTQYKNITVTIEVEGCEDMPIQCYRMKGEGAENLVVGDVIRVTGTIINYNGKVEFNAGCTFVEYVPTTPEEILNAAYALETGATLENPNPATLTGTISSIDTAYSTQYKNVTVTIKVEGCEDMPIQCFRMKGEGAENLVAGDKITVTGTIKNYNGKVEFDAGCTFVEYVPTPEEILEAAYALETGATLENPNPATLTGTISSIDTAYSTQYKNVTVTIKVEGCEDMPIQCFRMKGEGAENLVVGDVITVTGTIKNYNGKVEFDANCTFVKDVQEEPSVPTTPEEILEAAYALAENTTLENPNPATLTGTIKSIDTAYSSSYGNITVTIEVDGCEDMPIKCFRMKGEGAENLAVGDVITVTGIIKNYYGTVEFDANCTFVK